VVAYYFHCWKATTCWLELPGDSGMAYWRQKWCFLTTYLVRGKKTVELTIGYKCVNKFVDK